MTGIARRNQVINYCCQKKGQKLQCSSASNHVIVIHNIECSSYYRDHKRDHMILYLSILQYECYEWFEYYERSDGSSGDIGITSITKAIRLSVMLSW